jgi:hypothetical protein
MATTITDQNKLIYKTAQGRHGGSNALVEKAKAGDKAALAALNQSVADTHTAGQTKDDMAANGVGFNYLLLAKQLESEVDGETVGGKKIQFTEADIEEVRKTEKRYDSLLRKAHAGNASMEELEEINTLRQKLEELTLHARENQEMWTLATEKDEMDMSDDAEALEKSQNWAQGVDALAQRDEERDEKQKAEAEAQKRAEEEAEYRKIMLNIAKRVERTMDNDRITVQTDSW